MSENQNKPENTLPSSDNQLINDDENTVLNQSNIDEEEEQEPLYFGRFTRGTWRGGLLGIALSYFVLALLGFANDSFSLGINKLLDNSIFTYGLLIVLCYVGGKIGKTLEAKAKENK